MISNPLSIASRSRNTLAIYHRLGDITTRYGMTAALMDDALLQFSEILQRFDCPATFPITAIPLKRYRETVEKYLIRNIEFAVHGYTHIDYGQQDEETIDRHIQAARDIFSSQGITPNGFRSPYLSRSAALYTVLQKSGFVYASNQPFLWEVVDLETLNPSIRAAYERAISCYDPWKSGIRLSLPKLANELVEIPVSLPDDEILIDRLGSPSRLVTQTWLSMLNQSYRRGELFTLQLHPERTTLCADSLLSVLAEARQLTPAIWCARLDEIATWWRERSTARLEISTDVDGEYYFHVEGPEAITVLARGVDLQAPNTAWLNGYRMVNAHSFHCRSPFRPVIGVSPTASPQLIHFLRQQGYVLESNSAKELYSTYLDSPDFTDADERKVVEAIEGSGHPLVKLGHWPDGYASALCVSGDIDAFTLWDYGLRVFGR
jgi:hypothetical protein